MATGLEAAEARVVLPGDALGRSSEFDAGAGTFERDGMVYASLAGVASVSSLAVTDGRAGTLFVEPAGASSATVVPEVGDVVIGRVLRIHARQAAVSILSVDGRAVREPFAGVIRKENVRDTEIDRVEVHHSFRPGDIVVAEVISLGDARNYFLSTAKVGLGVLNATSEAGHAMEPVSFQEMRCPVSGAREKRKVARVGF